MIMRNIKLEVAQVCEGCGKDINTIFYDNHYNISNSHSLNDDSTVVELLIAQMSMAENEKKFTVRPLRLGSLLCSLWLKLYVLQVMIMELAERVREFLHIYNKPPAKSFHEQMLDKQKAAEAERAQRQQEQQERERRRREEEVLGCS